MDIRMRDGSVFLSKGKLELTSGRGEALAQRLTIRLKTHRESWFLNLNFGVDYFKRIFEKNIPKSSIDSVFMKEINSDERVSRITYFSSHIKNRVYYLQFKVKAKDGAESELVSLEASPNKISF